MQSSFFPWNISAAILSAALVLPPGSSRAETPGDLPLRDEFDSKLTLDWETIRPDPTHLSLETHPGKLTITTQYGSIHQAQTTAKNLFFIDVPEGVDDFVATTCVENFLPEAIWQQAGLLFYDDDDDNFIKWVRDFSSQRFPVLNANWEIDQADDRVHAPVEMSKERFWLRVIKRGNHYQCAASLDGKEFTTYAVIPWGDGSPKKVGLVAKNGPREGDMEAQFDFFKLRRPTEAERDDPAYKARVALVGTWKAATRRFDGKRVTKGPATQLIVTLGTLTLDEGQKMIMTYTVDPTTSPNRITLIAQKHGVGRLLNGIYSLEEETLTICLNTKLNGPPPDSLETTEGDGRMLLKLERADESQ